VLRRLRITAIAILLVAQLAGIIRARFRDETWFAWAPNDQIVEYELAVAISGRSLTEDEIASRYQIDARGVYQQSAANLISIVGQYEASHGARDHAVVRLTYRVDGGARETWDHPPGGDRPR
jgi:hypothetical protein